MKPSHCVFQYIESHAVTSQTEICFHERQQLPLKAVFHFNRIVVILAHRYQHILLCPYH